MDNLQNLKDPLIVAVLFFVVASDWFDNWLKDLFPQLRTSNPIMYTLIKTLIFFGIYWLYKYLAPRFTNNSGSSSVAPTNQNRTT